jgi:hypothetical protein
MAFLTFLARLLQHFLEFLDFLSELREVILYGIVFLTAFLSGAEIRLLLSVFLKPTTLMCVVHGKRAPVLLAQVAMLLSKANLLRHMDRSLGTREFLPFLALVRRLLGRFQFALLVGTHMFNRLQRSEKQAHVYRSHTFLVKVVLVLPLDRAHTQHMSPQLSLREWDILGLGAGVRVGAVVEARHLGDVGVELLYTTYKLTHLDALGLLKYVRDIVLFLLSCIDGKRSEKVKHHAIVEQLARRSPWAFQGDTLKVDLWVTFCLLVDDLVPRVLALRRKQI